VDGEDRENPEMVSSRVRLFALAALVAQCSALGASLGPNLPAPPPASDALQEPLIKLLSGGQTIEVEGKDAVRGAIAAT
jgi:hypothetical protein